MAALSAVLQFGWPNTAWSLSAPYTYADLVWRDASAAKPTEDEVSAKAAQMA